MEPSSNIYKYNLSILSNLEESQTIYYEENKIFIEDRYFGRFRYGNNPIKIIEIIKSSFLHYYNQLLLELNTNELRNEILELLKSSVNGLKKISIESELTENEKIKYENLRKELLTLLIELNETSVTNTDDSSEDESDSETCLRSMLHTAQTHLDMDEHNVIVNTIYVIKNKIVFLVLKVGNLFYDMTNF